MTDCSDNAMCLAPFPNEAADIDNSSRLDETYKADLVKIDTNKDRREAGNSLEPPQSLFGATKYLVMDNHTNRRIDWRRQLTPCWRVRCV